MNAEQIKINIAGIEGAITATKFWGKEYISKPFEFLISIASSQALDANTLLGKPASITITTESESRSFHGIIDQVNAPAFKNNDQLEYIIRLSPHFLILDKTSDCRTFVNKSIPEIIQIVLKENCLTDFDLTYLTNIHQKKELCIQFNESAFGFVSRLIHECGANYYFKHDDSRHTLIIDNRCYAAQTHATPIKAQVFPSYSSKQQAISTQDYQFQSPQKLLESFQGKQKSKLCINHYPAPSPINNAFELSEQTAILLNQINSDKSIANIETQLLELQVMHKIQMQDDISSINCGEYLTIEIEHNAQDNNFFNTKTESFYTNKVVLSKNCQNYLASTSIIKPICQSPCNAIVVGPVGREIYTDKYGRVKVQFIWDKHGKYNEDSSSWIRVKQPWAGKNHGTLFTPRVGQEVLVNFISGDPDRPIIIGTLNNSHNEPIFKPKGHQAPAGLHSHTISRQASKKGNILQFDDTNQQEKIHLLAQKDLFVTTKNQLDTHIKQNSHSTIKQGNWEKKVDGNWSVEAKQEIKIATGTSKILIDISGVTIEADEIHLN